MAITTNTTVIANATRSHCVHPTATWQGLAKPHVTRVRMRVGTHAQTHARTSLSRSMFRYFNALMLDPIFSPNRPAIFGNVSAFSASVKPTHMSLSCVPANM